jgi:sortase A
MTTDIAPFTLVDPYRPDPERPGMASEPRVQAAGPRKLLMRRVVGTALAAFGLLLLLLILFVYAFTPLVAGRDQHRLLGTLSSDVAAAAQSTFALTKGNVPPEGSPVALLRIPSLNLRQAVVAGTSASDLEAGPGLMPGTALPGEQGNVVIAGRSTTFGGPFGAIGSLQRGDQIMVTDGLGTFRYDVTSVGSVTTGQSVIGVAHANQLTLTTSNSSVVTTGLRVVRAKLVGKPVAPPVRLSRVIPANETGLSGQPGAGWNILLWTVLFFLAVAATGVALWRWRKPLPTYLLAAPILLACGLFAVEAVALALPATL